MNQGAYRPESPAGGFPLPRRGLGVATAFALVLAFFCVLIPLGVLAALGSIGHVMAGGFTSLFNLLLMLVGPVLVGVLGVMLLRGRRIPPLALFGVATLPYLAALYGALAGLTLTTSVLGGASIDPEQKGRILADGIGETMMNDVFGGLVAGAIALVVVAVAASSVATVAGSNPKTPFPVVVAGALWLLGTVIVGVLRLRNAGGMAFGTVPLILVLVPYAIVAGRQAAALRQWNDKADAESVAGALVIAGVAAVFAVLAIQRAFEASMSASALRALSSPMLDPSQQMRILGAAVFGRKLGPAAYAIHAVFGTLTFALATLPVFGKGPDGASRSPVTGGAVVAIVGGLVLVGLTFGLGARRTAAIDKLTVGTSIPPDVTIPHAKLLGYSKAMSPGMPGEPVYERVVRKTDAAGTAPSKCSGAAAAIAIADKDASVGALQNAVLTPTHACGASIALRVDPELSSSVAKELGDWSKFLPNTNALVLSLSVAPLPAATRGRKIEVESKSATQLKIDGAPVPFPLTDATRPTASGAIDQIDYVFDHADTVGHVVDVITSVEQNLQYAMSTSSTPRYVRVSY